MTAMTTTTPNAKTVSTLGRPLIIGLDVDEVCADLLTEWLRRYNLQFGDTLTRSACTEWDMTKLVTPACGTKIYDYLKDADLYDKVEPIPGALRSVHALREQGHQLHFITSCVEGPMADAKRRWLRRHGFFMGEANPEGVYHACMESKEKLIEQLQLDVLVDDRPVNLEAAGPAVHRILFDAPHNRCTAANRINAKRARDWDAVVAHIMDVEGCVATGCLHLTERDQRVLAERRTALADRRQAPRVTGRVTGRAEVTPKGYEALGLTPPVTPPPAATGAATGAATSESKPTNPKDLIGSNKLPLGLFPATAIAMGSLGMLDGALKYGRDNYRAIGIRASVYIDAAFRHLEAWLEGEDVAPDSGVPHLGHALACLAIIVDAQAAGVMDDDRRVAGGYHQMSAELTAIVAKLRAMHRDKHPKHYSIKDTRDPSRVDPKEESGAAA